MYWTLPLVGYLNLFQLYIPVPYMSSSDALTLHCLSLDL